MNPDSRKASAEIRENEEGPGAQWQGIGIFARL